MDDAFKIHIERLRGGHVEKIEEVFSPDFLEIEEKELSYPEDVTVTGEAYLTEDSLVLNLHVSTGAIRLCSICNIPVKVGVHIKGYYHIEPIASIKGGVFNFKETLRELVLLETPSFAECEGNCPRRKEISKYLKSEEEGGKEKEGYHPFADLDFK